MSRHTTILGKLTLAVVCAAAVAACSKPADQAASSDTAGARTENSAGRLDSSASASMDTAHNMNAMPGNTTNAAWSTDRIFGFAHNADNGEIALGKLASTKATGAQVKAFGREMVKDHEKMMADAHAMFGKLNAKPDTAADDARDLMKHGQDELKELTEKTAGADWDKAFIDNEIDSHQKVLDKLTDAAKSSTDKTVTDGLAKATAMVQEHLTKAQTIKAALK